MPYVPVGPVQCVFRWEFRLFQRYRIKSAVHAWDRKWLFVVSKFVLNDGGGVVAVTKYAFKRGRVTMMPAELKAWATTAGK